MKSTLTLSPDPLRLSEPGVIDTESKVAKIESGNVWKPADLGADLKKTPTPVH